MRRESSAGLAFSTLFERTIPGFRRAHIPLCRKPVRPLGCHRVRRLERQRLFMRVHNDLPYLSPGRHKSRYGTGYVFAVFDKPDNLIVEFTGATLGPSERVKKI